MTTTPEYRKDIARQLFVILDASDLTVDEHVVVLVSALHVTLSSARKVGVPMSEIQELLLQRLDAFFAVGEHDDTSGTKH